MSFASQQNQVAMGAGQVGAPPLGGAPPSLPEEKERLHMYILQLSSFSDREEALLHLSSLRETTGDMAPLLWHTFGAISALLLEIVSVYPELAQPVLSAGHSNRVCNALLLLQCVASHPETRTKFIKSDMSKMLHPLIKSSCKQKPYVYLRVNAIGIIGALVKSEELEVMNHLLNTEVVPLCLEVMENREEFSKTGATFILQKMLFHRTGTGLHHICQRYDLFLHVVKVLDNVVSWLCKEKSSRLFKQVINCYLGLSDNPNARNILRRSLPNQLRNGTFAECFKNDYSCIGSLNQLLTKLRDPPQTQSQGAVATSMVIPARQYEGNTGMNSAAYFSGIGNQLPR